MSKMISEIVVNGNLNDNLWFQLQIVFGGFMKPFMLIFELIESSVRTDFPQNYSKYIQLKFLKQTLLNSSGFLKSFSNLRNLKKLFLKFYISKNFRESLPGHGEIRSKSQTSWITANTFSCGEPDYICNYSSFEECIIHPSVHIQLSIQPKIKVFTWGPVENYDFQGKNTAQPKIPHKLRVA